MLWITVHPEVGLGAHSQSILLPVWRLTIQLTTTFRKGPVVSNKVVWFKSH